jgi:formylglycine-generating enzyme required for sulfatase activity
MRHRLLALVLAATGPAAAAPIDWQRIGAFEIARTETTIAQFRAFAQATGTVTAAERRGGGEVYEAGWTRKPGWTWQRPYGPGHVPADDEPAVHLTWHEAPAQRRRVGQRRLHRAARAATRALPARPQLPLAHG